MAALHLTETAAEGNDGAVSVGEVPQDALDSKAGAPPGLSPLKESDGTYAYTLMIEVVSGSGLLACDRGNTSDPFVKVLCGPELLGTTNVVKASLNPVWNATFSHRITAPLSKSLRMADKVSFLVYDKDKFSKPDPMGAVRLQIYEMIEHDRLHGTWREEDYTVEPVEGCKHPTGTLRIRTAVQEHRRVSSFCVSTSASNIREGARKEVDGA